MNHFCASAFGALLLLSACAKKEQKPLHTEPWLAHPPASAAAGSEAGLPTARYALTAQSQIHFELPSKHGTLHGTLTRVSGELNLTPGDLEHSHGQVQVDLSSLTLSEDGNADTNALLTRARRALGLTDSAADASSPTSARPSPTGPISPGNGVLSTESWPWGRAASPASPGAATWR